ncbi:putative quinol monooxygenase [Desulfogranum japonicum]|uniref:putative quinol monooxygenase n=1 Tax=Desulfogranum japonicum TaxID=231447 RepID=UPI0003FC9E3F|nr:putative quinol monooxygenase [Desulfogranum japonicum]
MIHVLASITVKEGKKEEFLEIFKALTPKVLVEDGCMEYGATVDIETGLPMQILNSNIITIVEKWKSVAALNLHLASPHMADFLEQVDDLVEELTLKVLQPA